MRAAKFFSGIFLSITLITSYAYSQVNTFPYLENFESGAGGWTSSAIDNTINDWELGTPASQVINSANSGVNAWKTNLDGRYANPASGQFTRSQVVSPLLDLSNVPYFEISLAVWWESQIRTAGANLQISNNDGASWTTVGAAGDPSGWYNSNTVSGLSYTGSDDGWAGYNTAGTIGNSPYASAGTYNDGSGSWVTATNDAVGGSSQSRLRVTFGANSLLYSDEGFAFDDVRITPALGIAQTDSFITDVNNDGYIGVGDTVRFTTVLTNQISSNVDGIMVTDLLNDANLSLVVGSVTTSQGTVLTGNTPGDSTVAVDVETISRTNDATITYDVTIGGLAANTVCAQGSVTATQFGQNAQITDDPDTQAFSDSTCVPRDIDADGIPDSTDPDDDNDGSSDDQEAADGTNPLDSGSNVPRLSTLFCSEWNGFLGMFNINEYVSSASTRRDLDVQLYDINGNLQSTTRSGVLANAQTDVLVHDLLGFTANSYGRTCTEVAGAAGEIDGRTMLYHPDFDFALALPYFTGKAGSQFVQFNTFHPKVGSDNFVANWVTIINEESSAQTGTIYYYGQNGSVLGSENKVLAAGSRFDFAGHQFGAKLVGLVEWRPASITAKFVMRNIRYYYNNNGEITSFDSAIQLAGAKGTGEQIVVPLDRQEGYAVLELSNVSNAPSSISLKINDVNGVESSNRNITLAAYSTTHVVIDNSVFTSEIGSATIDGSVNSVIAHAIHYGVNQDEEFTNAYSVLAREATGSILSSSYNTFLNQGCNLIFVNKSAQVQSSVVTMTRSDGTAVLTNEPIVTPPNGTANFDLCSGETDNNYGSVKVVPDSPNTIYGYVLRNGAADQYKVATELTVKDSGSQSPI